NVAAGTIIEYKFRYAGPGPVNSGSGDYVAMGSGTRSNLAPVGVGSAEAPTSAFKQWAVQSELFTVKESLRLKAYEVRSTYSPQDRPLQIGDVIFNLKDKPKESGNELVLELQNVPGYVPGEYMPPENMWRSSVLLFYAHKASSVDKEWEAI